MRKRQMICSACFALIILLTAIWSWGQITDSHNNKALNGNETLRLVTRLGHSSIVLSVAISTNGKYVLTGSSDNTARLWESGTGREIRRFEEHSLAVNSVAFSRDTNYVLTGSEDKTARLWEIKSGKVVQRFNGHLDSVSSVAISMDGRYVLTGSHDRTARLWEARSGNEIRRFEGHFNFVNSVFISESWRYALTGSVDGTVRLWEIESGREIRRLKGGGSYVLSVTLSADGKYILLGGSDNTARLYETESGREVQRFEGHSDFVLSVAFSGDGKYALTGSRDGTARLWKIEGGREIKRFEELSSYVRSVTFTADGKYLLTSEDNIAKLWETESGREVQRFGGQPRIVNSIALAADGKYALVGSPEGAALWDMNNGREVKRFEGRSFSMRFVSFSADGEYLVTVEGNVASLWETRDGRILRRFEGHIDKVNSAAFSSDGKYVLTGSVDQTARLWEAESGKEIKCFKGHSRVVHSVAISASGKYALTGSWDKTARLWDIRSGHMIRKFEGHTGFVKSVAFSADEKSVLTASGDNTARLWEIETGSEKMRFEAHLYLIESVALSSNGKYVLIGGSDNTARLLETRSGRQVSTFIGHSNSVSTVAFLVDGKYVLTGSEDSTARLWNTFSGEEICGLISFHDGNWSVVAPDGRFDASSLEYLKGLHWVIRDEPMRALPLEIFTRDYYEPRLLPRLLACRDAEIRDRGACERQFKPIRPLSELNRIQPSVKILGFKRGASADEVLVDIESLGKEDSTQSNGKTKTAAYDVRLFRNGQLVGQWPSPRAGIGGPENLNDWRRSSNVPKPIHTFPVRLATKDIKRPVTFTAYVFNEDRVKSETTQASYLPPDILRRKAHAYVITIGVNGYQNPKRNLEFAVKDARDMSQALGQIQDYEVVSVSLLSDAPGAEMPKNTATKGKIRALLGVLTDGVARAELAGVANAEKLTKATPDDLVILSFSGHGHTGRDGTFFLLPSDSGTEKKVTKESLKKFISSKELSEWMREMDAGQMAMIIDACHSAASIDSGAFKPGPMGDWGLGQLAYDKGMWILAATQADDVALEVRGLYQGLLTYALAWEGLSRGEGGKLKSDLNGDGEVTMEEWLKYGEQRVPTLYNDARAGKLHIVSKDPVGSFDQIVKRAQTPALFDFNKNSDGVVIRGKSVSSFSGPR